ncbi:MAG: hypothetical protein HXY35_12955 [Chloroflexi bacterium]|nr:hypothetical protein [Chloroflexota bacterium]
MKKVLQSAAGILFAVFSIAILGLLMSLTFGALGKLFPDNFMNQIWGLVLFDIAAMIWALVFVFKSESTMQYALSAIGFIAAFLGTLGMVAVEVMLGGQTFIEVESWVGEWLVYGYVIMTALHSALLYAHHATAPEIHEKINVGIARGEIVTEAIKQATDSLEVQKAALAENIHRDIVNQVKRDLGLSRGQVLDLPALPILDTPAQKPASFSLANLLPFTWAKSKPKVSYQATVPAVSESEGATPPAPFLGNQPKDSPSDTPTTRPDHA